MTDDHGDQFPGALPAAGVPDTAHRAAADERIVRMHADYLQKANSLVEARSRRPRARARGILRGGVRPPPPVPVAPPDDAPPPAARADGGPGPTPGSAA